MTTNDEIVEVKNALQSIERGSPDTAAVALARLLRQTKNRRMKSLIRQLVKMHGLMKYIKEHYDELREWELHMHKTQADRIKELKGKIEGEGCDEQCAAYQEELTMLQTQIAQEQRP